MKAKKPNKKIMAKVRKLVKAGNWITAIQVYRVGTGSGLAESVEIIRKMREEVTKEKYGIC